MSEPIRTAVSTAVAEFFGRGATVEEWHGPEQREWSWQFAFRVAGVAGGEFIAKVPRWEEAPTLEAAVAAGEQAATAAEFAGLVEIADAVAASGDPGLAAVEPVVFVGPVNTIVMRRLEAVRLRSRVGVVRSKGDVAALFTRLGRWLALFHGLGGVERIAWDPAAEQRRLAALERRLQAAEIPSGRLGEAIASLGAWVDSFKGVDEPSAPTHGDLNMSNVLVTPDDRVAVIDPNRSQGFVLDDAARVITDVRLEKRQLAGGWLLRRLATADGWERSLTSAGGYATEALLPYRLARHAVERWVEAESTSAGPARLGLVVARRLLSAETKRRLGPGRAASS